MAIFRGKKDIEFVKRLNRELIEHIVGEKITYYPISRQFSETDFYGESKEKVVDPPVEVYSLVKWNDQLVKTTEFGIDTEYSLTVYILNEYLEQIELKPLPGDMINYDAVMFEITSVSQPNLTYGKADEKLGTKLECVSVRESSFIISVSASTDNPSRTRPDDDGNLKNIYDDIIFPYSGSY